MPEVTVPTGATAAIPAAVKEAILADKSNADLIGRFCKVQAALGYEVPMPESLYKGDDSQYADRGKALSNITHDVRTSAVKLLDIPEDRYPEGLVIRSKNTIHGKGNAQKVTVTLFFGEPTAAQKKRMG